MTQATPKRRGRPPTTYEYINGEPYITAEILEKEAEKLERHRKQCREGYRNKTRILKTLRPDLFEHNRNGNTRINGQIVRQWGIPIESGLLQPTQEEGNTSNTENGNRIREITIGEASLGPWSRISR